MSSIPLRKNRRLPRHDRFDRADEPFSIDLWSKFQRSFFCPNATLHNRHILNMNSLTRCEMELVLAQAAKYRQRLRDGERLQVMDGLILATLFYEPSTRTRLSFESAMHRLGGQVISTPDGRSTSSAAKGESIADSIRTVCGYADVIAQRHPEIGSAQAAAAAAHLGIPVINAGDGAGEHPTQALLDLFTILDERGTLDGLHVILAGDLKHGRTVHSLVQALCHWDVRITLAAPAALTMPRDLINSLPCSTLSETDDLSAAAESADVLYMTRIQKERFVDPTEYEALRGQFVVDSAFMRERPNLTLMHPLPRVDEIAPNVDQLPNAAYFRQTQNGLYVRMALLALVKGRAI